MLEKTKLTGQVRDFTGAAYTGPLTIDLERTAVDQESGFVLAGHHEFNPGADGRFELMIWPNARAETETHYLLTAPGLGLRLRLMIPDQPEVDLSEAVVD